jgi:hypothetical protein
LLALHEGSEFVYLLIDVLLGIRAIPDIAFLIRVIAGYDARIETPEPPKMRRKSSRPAPIETPEITVKKAPGVQDDDHGPRSITAG